jgi:hypothetical protein
MSERDPFRPKAPAGPRTLLCEEWEALLADALDGSLPPGDTAAFQTHQATCDACQELFTRARQGQEWLHFLHEEPPVPADLLSRILASTSGAAAVEVVNGAIAQPKPQAPVLPFWKRVPVPPALRRLAEPRLMMTAAMAFFSIALTLNLAGVRLTAVRISDLKPSVLRTNLTRQIINSKAGVVRYYDNLRFVYEMEAKMRELRRATESEEPAEKKPQQQTAPPPASAPAPQGSAHKNGGKSESPRNAEPRAMIWGRTVEACLRLEPRDRATGILGLFLEPAGETAGTTTSSWVSVEADQAERSLA